MVTLLDRAEQEFKDAAERLEKASTAEHAAALEQALPDLAERIKSGTVTVGYIDSILNTYPQVKPEVKEYLLGKKGYLLLQQGKQEEGLRNYDYALATIEKPITWALKGNALLQMDRTDEALQAFQRSYELRDDFGRQEQEYLKDLFWVWGTTTFLLGLDAVLEQDSTKLRKKVHEFLDIAENAKSAGLEAIPGKVVFREPGNDQPDKAPGEAEHVLVVYAHEAELKEAVEELELAIKLLAIKDPFEGLRAMSKELSKYWPEGLSAMDAIREQRDREWNT